ncbi:MAG TPA: phosphoribosylanthranilate isomerase [Candidatus Limnocylindrales bacterium]|nr:phosphoribosylanthranilate isomerase [Candidatus Limnocylindrales bacterium]
MSVRVKICGVTSLADAQVAVESGADALGFNFYEKSPRSIPTAAAAEISRALPPFTLRTGVFVNPSEELVRRAIGECGLNLLQFHGDEPPDFCTQFGLMSMKAFRIRDAGSLKELTKYQTDAWLLDACSSDTFGGTGEKFNWTLAIEAQRPGKPVFLAGGLTPENVAEAVQQVQPFGVDVSSGVESSPGRKDPAKVRAFIKAAKTTRQ